MQKALYAGLLFLLGVAAVILLAMLLRASRRATRQSSRMGGIGWALLFLTSGRMPPPPPESQIEAELNGEKDRNASQGADPD